MRRKNRRGTLGSISGPATQKNLKQVAGVTIGLAVATIAQNWLSKRNSNGETVMGLDGDTTSYVVPVAMGIAGLLGGQLIKNDFAKDICTGVAAAGAAGLVNKATNKAIVTLSGDEMIPGLGDAETSYEQLPVYSGEPQEAYEVADATVEDGDINATEQGAETVSGVDDGNFFIA